MSKDSELTAETPEENGENLKLWRSVEQTMPEMTRDVRYGKRHYTTIDPQYQLRQATTLWGPYGYRWGLRNIKYRITEIRTHDKVTLDTRDSEGKIVQSVDVMADFIRYAIIVEAEFFFPWANGEASFQILNDDKFEVDDDVMKKVVTNTRSKALSWLGFSADVFMGKFDDTKYVTDLKAKYSAQNAFVNKAATKILEAKDLTELATYEQRLEDTIRNKTFNDKVVAKELRELIKERKTELSAE